MPKNVTLNRRSVATQSDLQVGNEVTTTSKKEFEINTKLSNLCKKSAYRNLLQRSITVDAHGRINSTLDFIKSGQSKATQTLRECSTLHTFESTCRRMRLAREESVELAIPMQMKSPEVSLSPSLVSQESLTTFDDARRGKVHYKDIPGTSKLLQSDSVVQIQERQPSTEGSLAIIYNHDERWSVASGISNITHVYGSQHALRRQSDEAVLLVQDYQSYDVQNTARRQDAQPQGSQRFRRKKKKHGKKGKAARPIPIIPETLTSPIACRICHEGEDIEPLIRPCLCKGSVGHIHAKCLKVWLEQSNTSRCEICGYPYAIRQTRRYPKCMSVTVFLRHVADRRALMYDLISFVAVTPLCIVGIAMCIRASIVSGSASENPATMNFQMGNVTKAGMIMLSTTIIIAYSVWLYTLFSYHYKSWRRWYNTCYDVEVIPVNMTSEERLQALNELREENRRRSTGVERGGSVVAVFPPNQYESFYGRRIPTVGRVQVLPQ